MALAYDLPGLPLSLQDMCMLHLGLRLEEFSLHSLALLPTEIKRRLVQGLSTADHLHLEGTTTTALFGDHVTETDRLDTNQLRKSLVDVLLYGQPAAFFSLHLNTILGGYFERFHDMYSEDYFQHHLNKHIHDCYSSLSPLFLPASPNMYNSSLLPKRFSPFVHTHLEQNGHHELQLLSSQAWSLLHYCNMQSAPSYLNIEFFNFKDSTFWKEFDQATRLAVGDAGSDAKLDLVIPFIQEFFSSVEVLELGSCARDYFCMTSEYNDAVCTIAYVLLYNILTSRQPCLKHLKIYGPSEIAYPVFQMAEELLHGVTQSFSSYINSSEAVVTIPLTPPPPPPNSYLLEGFSLGAETSFDLYMRDNRPYNMAIEVAIKTQELVNRHMQKLKHVEIGKFNYCFGYPAVRRIIQIQEYKKLLLVLIELLKQPQLCQLSLGKTPLPEGYKLIVTFLCTPAAHEQSLAIVVTDNNERCSVEERTNIIRGEEEEEEEDDMEEEEEDMEEEKVEEDDDEEEEEDMEEEEEEDMEEGEENNEEEEEEDKEEAEEEDNEEEEEEEDKEEEEKEKGNIEEGEIKIVKNEEEKKEHRENDIDEKENDTEREQCRTILKKRLYETPDDPPTMVKRLCIVEEQKETIEDGEEKEDAVLVKEVVHDERNSNEHQKELEDDDSGADSVENEPSDVSPETTTEACSTIVPPSFSNRILPETNIQFKCLDLGMSSDCVYSWLFTLPELKLKKLRMGTQKIDLLADTVIQVEHLSFTLGKPCMFSPDLIAYYSGNSAPILSQTHLEKFVISNLALRRLEFEYASPGLFPALNHCLSLLYRQGRGLEELVLSYVTFDPENVSDFFTRLRDLSHRYGTTLVLSPLYYRDLCNPPNLLINFSKEFQDKKIKKITCNYTMEDDPSISQLRQLTENLIVHYKT